MKPVLKAPSNLNKEAVALWNLTQTQLLEQGTFQPSDGPLLERYIQAVTKARMAREAAEDDPWVEGSKGQLVAHPGWKQARDCERDAEVYGKSLLLSPEMRLKHKITADTGKDELDKLLSD